MTSHRLTRREFVGVTAQGIAWSQLAGHVGMFAAVTDSDMARRFLAPSDVDKPWAYWWWLNGTVTEQSITRDLEEMRKKGFGGVLMFDARGYGNRSMPPPPPRFESRCHKIRISSTRKLKLEDLALLPFTDKIP